MISLHFTYQEDDYIPALRTYLLHKPKLITFFIFTSVLTLGLLKLILGGYMDSDSTLFILLSVVSLLGLAALLLYVLPRWRFKHSYKSVDEHWIHINEKGIFTETEFENSVLPWRRCTKLIEGEQFYLFEHDHRRVTVIPKRTFKNSEEEIDFRTLLRNKLKPALSSKVMKEKDPAAETDYLPPEKMPDWR